MDFSTFTPRLYISSSAKKIKSTIRRFAKFRDPFTKKRTRKRIHYESITYKAIVNGVDPIAFVLKSIIEIYKYKYLGAQRCLYLLNEKEYEDLCDKINDIKVSIVKIYKDDNDEQSIEILKNKNKHYEKIRSSFNKWFEKNGYPIPDTQGLDTYYQIYHDKIIHDKKNNIEEDLQDELTCTNLYESPIDINNFHILTIYIPEHPEYTDKIGFQLIGDQYQTKIIEISQEQGAFLLFLAYEREQNEENWLSNPESHYEIIKEINNKLCLKRSYVDAVDGENSAKISWFIDFKNKNRKRIVGEIHKALKSAGNVTGQLIKSCSKANPARAGNYSLAKFIRDCYKNTCN